MSSLKLRSAPLSAACSPAGLETLSSTGPQITTHLGTGASL